MLEGISMFKSNNENKNKVIQILIEDITPNPYQPRKHFDLVGLEELSKSIKQYGVLQPISVRKKRNSKYELIAGERRLRAAKIAGFKDIPSIVHDLSENDSAIIALIENLQREDLSYMEEAEGYFQLISEHNLTQEELAIKIGRNQSTIANKLRLLRLSDKVKRIIDENDLTERHARSLLKLPDESFQLKILDIVIKKGLNVKKTEELIENTINSAIETKPKQKTINVFRDMRIYINTLDQAVKMLKKSGLKVESTQKEKDEYIEYVVKIPKNI